MEWIPKQGDYVMARYNKRSKWQLSRIWEIDNTRCLPYGIEKFYPNEPKGKKGNWFHTFRANITNIKPPEK